jgi:hypothetical protein
MKTCKQNEHKWVEISTNPWRYRCSVCKVIGKIKFKKKWKQWKVIAAIPQREDFEIEFEL